MPSFRVRLAEQPTAVLLYLGERGPSTAQAVANDVTTCGGTYSAGLSLLRDLGLVAVDTVAVPPLWALTADGVAAVADGGARHDGAGSGEHLLATDVDGLAEGVVAEWCLRTDELLERRPAVAAHRQRNVEGKFAFSPATCPLCGALAELELQALRDVGIDRNPTAAS